jgi:hypothetical protein
VIAGDKQTSRETPLAEQPPGDQSLDRPADLRGIDIEQFGRFGRHEVRV